MLYKTRQLFDPEKRDKIRLILNGDWYKDSSQLVSGKDSSGEKSKLNLLDKRNAAMINVP